MIQGEKIRRLNNKAVSGITGTILLLAIGITLFTLVGIFFFPSLSDPSPSVNIASTIEFKENGASYDYFAVFDHLGGDSISTDTEIQITIEGVKDTIYPGPTNMEPSNAADNNKWDMGERVKYALTGYNYEPVEILVISKEDHKVLTTGTLQADPWVDIKITMIYSKIETSVEFTITATFIEGTVNSVDLLIKDYLPEELTYDGSTPSQGTYDPNTGIWDLEEPLGIGDFATLEIDAIIGIDEEVTNTAKLWDSTYSDIDHSNNQDSAYIGT
jgi:FlaG/FlaF family flagellin (archaellin)